MCVLCSFCAFVVCLLFASCSGFCSVLQNTRNHLISYPDSLSLMGSLEEEEKLGAFSAAFADVSGRRGVLPPSGDGEMR